MLLSIFHNYCFWAYGGTVDTLVLGTSLARGESSNLSKPTSKCLPLVKLADKLRSCVACCVESNLLRNMNERMQCLKVICLCRRLRNEGTHFNPFTTAYSSSTTTLLFNINSLCTSASVPQLCATYLPKQCTCAYNCIEMFST